MSRLRRDGDSAGARLPLLRFHFDPSTDARAAVPAGFGKRGGFLVWAIGSALLMAIGAFGPWISTPLASVAGISGSNDGWIVIGAVVLGSVPLFLTRQYRAAGMWVLLGGILGAAVTIYDRHHAAYLIGQQSALVRELVQIGWGRTLAMISSISLAVCGLVWLLAVETVPAMAEPPPAAG